MPIAVDREAARTQSLAEGDRQEFREPLHRRGSRGDVHNKTRRIGEEGSLCAGRLLL